jgi:hypothetical protein
LAESVTFVTPAPPELAANFAPEELDDRPIVMAEPFVVALPKLSSRVVANPLVAELLAAALKAVEVMASLLAVAAAMVTPFVDPVTGCELTVAVALIVGLPAFVSE